MLLLRHQRRRAGEDIILGQAFPQNRRLLRIRKRGGETITLDHALPVRRVLRAGVITRSHVLTKRISDRVVLRWQVSNLGSARGSVRIKLLEGSNILTTGPTNHIQAGLRDIGLIITFTLPATFPIGRHDLTLVMEDITGGGLRIIGSHSWTLTIQNIPSTLTIVSQAQFRITTPSFCVDTLCFTWNGSVRNSDPTQTRFFRPTKTETTPEFGGPFLRQLTTRSVGPSATESWSSNASSDASRAFGEMWVREYDAFGSFIRDLGPKKPYSVSR